MRVEVDLPSCTTPHLSSQTLAPHSRLNGLGSVGTRFQSYFHCCHICSELFPLQMHISLVSAESSTSKQTMDFDGELQYDWRPLDSAGPSPLINGSQLETWRMLRTRFDLVDSFHCVCSFSGSRYTRWATHGDRLDQSRLDWFYLSDSGFWVHTLHSLQHIPSEALSDHDPIILTIEIESRNSATTLPKSSYLKANPVVLKIEGTIDALQDAWIAHPLGIIDPNRKFSLA